MTVVKAQVRFDEPVAEQVLEQALARGRQRAGQGVHATGVQYLAALKSLLVSFADQSALALPVSNYPELAVLNEAELNALTLGFGGGALCLPERDLHVMIAGLVAASGPLMALAATVVAGHNGRKSSPAKVQAARENGRKGGRPRLAVAE